MITILAPSLSCALFSIFTVNVSLFFGSVILPESRCKCKFSIYFHSIWGAHAEEEKKIISQRAMTVKWIYFSVRTTITRFYVSQFNQVLATLLMSYPLRFIHIIFIHFFRTTFFLFSYPFSRCFFFQIGKLKTLSTFCRCCSLFHFISKYFQLAYTMTGC